ncbi:arylsulfotransferase family protein [Spirillospora sp. NPDC048911]|uniref:arylsulfotransferase family protein n=1 Tax=Spirillospora sp. NPDC048911 TaxID=3364527 RepID=UPI0037166545
MKLSVEPAPEAGVMPAAAEIPRIRVITARPGIAPGYLFMSPQSLMEPHRPHGPQIVDDQGRVVWFHPVPEGQYATNVRVQRYRDEPVLTWWQGTATPTGVGDGIGYVLDQSYRVVATVRAAGGRPFDLHEFLLTDRGTALLVSYVPRPYDLRTVGGAEDGVALDGVVQEIDVATGELLMEWSGLDHVPLTESDIPEAISKPYDQLHVNSVAVDEDGDLLVTARMSSALYKVDRRTGDIVWKLGSSASTLVLGVGVRCFWPHDGQPCGDGVYRLFDNAANEMMEGYESRVVWIRVDPGSGTATFVRQITHPEHLSSVAEGNAQDLPNGNTLVGWGRAARISEFAPDGTLLFDACSPTGNGWTTYRVYRQEWDGFPAAPPEVHVDGRRVRAIWNGATGVSRWRVHVGGEHERRAVALVAWDGLETVAEIPEIAPGRFVSVEALDAHGRTVGTSPVVRVGP